MKKQFLIFALATALLFGASSRVYAIENDSMNTYAVAREPVSISTGIVLELKHVGMEKSQWP